MKNIHIRIYNLGIIIYTLMMVFAYFYYKERIIFCDAAFYLFNIIKSNSFCIQHMRWGAVCTEVLPLLALKLNLPLDSITLIYSESFIIFYFLCYVICGFVLKRYDIALLILLLNTLIVSNSFFWIDSELPQGITMVVVCFAYLYSPTALKKSKISYLLLCLLVIFTGWFHPLLFLPFYYFLAFMLLRNEQTNRKKAILGIGFLFFVTMLIRNVFFSSPYERYSMGEVKHFVTLFPNYFNLYAHKRFLYNCATSFYWIPLLGIANTIVYIWLKKWWHLALFAGMTIAYLFFIDICYPDKATPVFYIENLYLPLSIFVALPFVFDVLPMLIEKKAGIAVVALIGITFFVRIYTFAKPYTARLTWERKLLDKNIDKKQLIYIDRVPTDTLMLTWGTPYEFWLLSTIEYGRTASIIVVNNIEQYRWALSKTQSLLGAGDVIPYDQLPKRYFQFADTTSGYMIVK